MDADAWLQRSGLVRYAALLREKHIDGTNLGILTASDLEALGLEHEHAKQLFDALRSGEYVAPDVAREDQPSALDNSAFGAQRRYLTVLFCDLVGSTELSTRLDPEEMHELIQLYHRACAQCIEKMDGFVAKYLGDGVLAYFGYPSAHEDEAERSIRAGLLIAESVPRLATRHGGQLAVRIGIATGLVVVGDLIGAGWAQERAVVGETPNLAARLQAIAQPNRVVISNATHRLAGGLFEYRNLGAVSLKGIDLQEPVWEVVGASADADRFKAHHAVAPTPMIGRDGELQSILDLWRRRAGGEGHALGILGEAGIGKSRLVYEAHRHIAREPHIWIEGGGTQIFSNTPFYALSQMIVRLLSRHQAPSPVEASANLERTLVLAGIDADRALPLLAELIGVPTRRGLLTLNAEQRRKQLVEALAEWLLNTAARWPTVMVVEDAHWLDPSTVEVLDKIIENAAAVPLLLLYTARNGFVPVWPRGNHHTQIALSRLGGAELRRLVTAAAGHELSTNLLEKVLSRADGVPLFAEELAHLVSEQGATNRDIPATLSDLLMTRLDRLGAARNIAQIISVLGREVSPPLIEAVSGVEIATVRLSLEKLTAADILVVSGGNAQPVYSFKHTLLEDAAYSALLKSHRRELHRRAATTISERFRDMAAERPEIVAWHWTNAEEPEQAVPAWQRAAKLAEARHALKEAQSAYEQALAMLKTLSAGPGRDAREFTLQSALAGVLQITRGYSAPTTVTTIMRARELALSAGALPQQLQQAVGEWAAASSAGDYARAMAMAEHIRDLARADGRAANLAQAYMIQMTSCYRIGDLIAAEDHFSSGQRYFDAPEFRRRAGVIAQTFGNAALIAWTMGNAAEAGRRMESALAISAETKHPYDLTFAQSMSAVLALLESRASDAEMLARQSIALSQMHSFPQIGVISRIVLGRARVTLGDAREGISLIREGLRAMSETGSRVALTRYLTWLAEAQVLSGTKQEAADTIEEALRANPQELFFRPESLRLRGELQMKQGLVSEATADFREALFLSERMGATLFHARALASLERVSSEDLPGRSVR